MSNQHFVPKLILRKFKNKICLYNIKTGVYEENVKIDDAFSQTDLYGEATETKLKDCIESQFGNLLSNYILKSDGTVTLSRDQLFIVKKFLLISVLRSFAGERFVDFEKSIAMHGDGLKRFSPFEEKKIEGETSRDYWLRTLNVVLDTNGTPEEILEHEDKTYVAYRWSYLIEHAYLAFWDAPAGEEFVITDVGMTSENERGWDGIFVHNHKKVDYMLELYEEVKLRQSTGRIVPSRSEIKIINDYNAQVNFTENFMMFPTSSKRMIVLISPFFKKIYEYADFLTTPPALEELTNIPNYELFEPNRVWYKNHKNGRVPSDGDKKYHSDDRYIYDIKRLRPSELWYCNSLFLDRIDEYIGFSSLEEVYMSILIYRILNSPPYKPRVDYTSLYEILEKRYSIEHVVDRIKTERDKVIEQEAY